MIPLREQEFLREKFSRELVSRVRIDFFTQKKSSLFVRRRQPCQYCKPTGQVTRFGAVFDSVMDRASEAAVLFGLLYYYAGRDAREESLLAFAALAGSMLVSYIRARGEILGLQIKEGLFTRAERVIVIGVGSIIDQVRIALWILAVLANLTALQRLYLVWRKTRQGAGKEEPVDTP